MNIKNLIVTVITSLISSFKEVTFDRSTVIGLYIVGGVAIAYLNQKDIVKVVIDFIAFGCIVWGVYLIFFNRTKATEKSAMLAYKANKKISQKKNSA